MTGDIQAHTQVSAGTPTQRQHAAGKHIQAHTETRMPYINIPDQRAWKKKTHTTATES